MNLYIESPSPEKDMGGLCECFVSKTTGKQDVANNHMHQYFELLYCLEGRYTLYAGGEELPLNEGDVALIHPMVPHYTKSLTDGANRYLVLKFIPDATYSARTPLYELKYIFPYLHTSKKRVYRYSQVHLRAGHLPELLNSILQERQAEAYGYEIAVRAYVSQVLLWFLRAWNRDESRSPAMDEGTLLKLQQTMTYIDEHLTNELQVQDVARAVGMAHSSFSRFFTTAVGLSFPAYMKLKKLGLAAKLLVEKERSITEIAAEAGFGTVSYFILCFRKQYGITPKQFQKLYAQDNLFV